MSEKELQTQKTKLACASGICNLPRTEQTGRFRGVGAAESLAAHVGASGLKGAASSSTAHKDTHTHTHTHRSEGGDTGTKKPQISQHMSRQSKPRARVEWQTRLRCLTHQGEIVFRELHERAHENRCSCVPIKLGWMKPVPSRSNEQEAHAVL